MNSENAENINVNVETDKFESQDDFLCSQELNQRSEPTEFWARLHPHDSTLLKVQYLASDEFTVGRDYDCSYVLPIFKDGAQSKSWYQTCYGGCSNQHFKIIQVDGVALLEDLSTNGTFLNGLKIGKGKKVIIQSNDDIALAKVTNKVFTFMAKNLHRINFDFELPAEFTSQYVISKKLGSGACGDVYLASTKDYGEKYAAKIIKKAGIGADDKQSCLREVQIWRKTNHPNVVKITDVFDTETHLIILLEFMAGGELFDWITKYLPSFKGEERCAVVRPVFLQMVVAVKHLHENGIVHRDLKPENILLADQTASVIKITDFGLSKLLDQSIMKTRCGTPSYWAPEVIESESTAYTSAVDCWSLGVNLFLLLAGYPPFSAELKGKSLEKQIKTAHYTLFPKIWDEINPLAKDLMTELLVVDPEERLSIDAILAHPWLQDDESESEGSDDSQKNVDSDTPVNSSESTPTVEEGVRFIVCSSAPAVLERRPEGSTGSLGGKRKTTDLNLGSDDQDSDCDMPTQKRLKVNN